jgi:hypothetical protein
VPEPVSKTAVDLSFTAGGFVGTLVRAEKEGMPLSEIAEHACHPEGFIEMLMKTDEFIDKLARYMFQKTEDVYRSLATADVADFDEYVERNQDDWRKAARDLLVDMGLIYDEV